MSGSLQGKSTIVTGAASGIGRAASLMFAEAGAKLILVDWSEEAGEETADMVRKKGGTAKFIRADLSSESAVEGIVAEAVKSYGRLDCAFNNAGITADQVSVVDTSAEYWERMLRINLHGPFFCVKHEICQMLKNGGGAIVNTSSGLGIIAQDNCMAYCAAKAGVLALTRCAAIENAKKNIRVNALLPGVVRTGLLNGAPQEVLDLVESKHPIGRIAEPHEIAAAALWLLSDAASFVTATGLSIDGGFTAV